MPKRSNATRRRSTSTGYPADKARQGRIVLNTPTRRAVFFGGLIGFVVLALLVALL